VELLTQARGGDADHALMPALSGEKGPSPSKALLASMALPC
jgi:hypothetical protein